MRIPNVSVLALVAVFALVGPLVLPLGEWGWRWLHLAVVLVIGFVLNLARAVGGGDAKFAAAMAPFVSRPDAGAFLVLFAVMLLAAIATHRAARALPPLATACRTGQAGRAATFPWAWRWGNADRSIWHWPPPRLWPRPSIFSPRLRASPGVRTTTKGAQAMNMQVAGVMAPPAPRSAAEMRLPPVMMRDILLKTMFRTEPRPGLRHRARRICLPAAVTQELVDLARAQRLLEATGTLHASSGGEMGFQLTDAGKARALDALGQSEYFGAMPVPLDVYGEQVKRQSIRNIQITRDQLTSAMGHLILPERPARPPGPGGRRRAGRS